MQSQQENPPTDPLDVSQEIMSFYPPVRQHEKKSLKQFSQKHGFILVCIFFILLNWLLGARSTQMMQLISGFVILWLGIKFQVIVHELGHILMGLLTGRKLLSLCFGIWRYERTLTGLRWRTAHLPTGPGGFALMLPKHICTQSESKIEEILFLLGGALANLLCAGFFFWLAESGVLSKWLETLTYLSAAFALFIGVVNLLPRIFSGWYTDGKQILLLLKKRKDSPADTVEKLSYLSLAGVRPRDWPANEFFPVLADSLFKEQPFQVQYSHKLLQMVYALDIGDQPLTDTCALWMAGHFAQIPDGQRQGVAYCMAGYAAQHWHSVELFVAWRAWCDNRAALNLNPYYHFLDALHAWLLKDEQQTRYYIKKSRNAFSVLLSEADKNRLEENLLRLESSISTEKEGKIQNIVNSL